MIKFCKFIQSHNLEGNHLATEKMLTLMGTSDLSSAMLTSEPDLENSDKR